MKSLAVTTAAAIGLLALLPANAMDIAGFKRIANATVQDVIDGEVADVAALIAMQEELMAIGVAGARDYAAAHEEANELLTFVADHAEQMKSMSLDEIEEAWHEYGALEAAGIDGEAFDHFGPVISHMDAIIHPATALIALKMYQQDGDGDHLEQVKDELSEVLEHLSHL